MTYYLQTGNVYRPIREDEINLNKSLPPLTFAVKINEQTGEYYLQVTNSLTLPNKLYGDVTQYANRIFTSFKQRKGSTGIGLVGDKGTGKTLLAKTLSQLAKDNGIPTLLITDAYHGDAFNKFIQDITQEAVVIFDEFEKTYSMSDQERLLTLFDGVYETKKLFVVTCNDKYRIDDNLKNRPSRLYYMLDFGSISEETITLYCKDVLSEQNQKYTRNIVELTSMLTPFTFDMLQTLVEEMNRFNESPENALKLLNIRMDNSQNNTYDIVKVVYKGKSIHINDIHGRTTWVGNPIAEQNPDKNAWRSSIEVCFHFGEDYCTLDIDTSDLVGYDKATQTYIYKNSNGDSIVIKAANKKQPINPLAL